MTCDGTKEVVSQVKVPWGSESDRSLCDLISASKLQPTPALALLNCPEHALVMRRFGQVRELMGQFPPITPLALLLKQFLADRSLDHPYCQIEDPFYFENNVGSTCFRIQQIVK
ncbi:unnamed protein product [Sphagnum compactum]